MMMPTLRFHHVGYACRNIDREMAAFTALGYEQEGPSFEDPIQGVRGVFMIGPGPRIELLAPLEGATVLDPYLKVAARLYHFAYETADLEAALAYMVANKRAKITCRPVPSAAFSGRHIAFFMLPNLFLTELIVCPSAETEILRNIV